MGMQTPNQDDQGSYGSSTGSVLSEINVTPLVDVMLVLLIIFMVSAPMMQQGVQVDLPQNQAPTLDEQEENVILTVDKNKKIFLGKQEIAYSTLAQQVARFYKNRTKKEIYVQADESVSYGYVANVIAGLKNAGIERVGLVSEPE
jgi:biopolymer transport protein TolR